MFAICVLNDVCFSFSQSWFIININSCQVESWLASRVWRMGRCEDTWEVMLLYPIRKSCPSRGLDLNWEGLGLYLVGSESRRPTCPRELADQVTEDIESKDYGTASGWMLKEPFLIFCGGTRTEWYRCTECHYQFYWTVACAKPTSTVSVSCNFLLNPISRGGHSVVFWGICAFGTNGETCCCEARSTQRACVSE